MLLDVTVLSSNLVWEFSHIHPGPVISATKSLTIKLTRSIALFSQQAPDVATVIKATKHIADEVNGLKKMSSEELTQTVDVLQNVKEKMQHFNTSKKEAGELIRVP